jgi:hypothetical protein
MASGSHPASIIQPDSVFCGMSGCHLRRYTVPNAQVMAAMRIITAPNGAWRITPISSQSNRAMPHVPSARPSSFCRDSGSCSTNAAISVAQIGMV